MKIRWKRLVIDEDRLASESEAISTALIISARLLSAERTWFITSTPITNLSGLNLGNEICHEDLQLRTIQASRRNTPASNTPASNDVEDDEVIEIDERGSRRWSKKDHKDLNKLGNLITITMPQFRAKHSQSLIASRVIRPLLDVGGPKPGSIQVLVQFMETIMIQHAEPDLEGMPVVVDD